MLQERVLKQTARKSTGGKKPRKQLASNPFQKEVAKEEEAKEDAKEEGKEEDASGVPHCKEAVVANS